MEKPVCNLGGWMHEARLHVITLHPMSILSLRRMEAGRKLLVAYWHY